MSESAAEIRARRNEVAASTESLKAAPLTRRAEWLSDAARRLAEAGERAALELAESTRLSRPMVEWGIRTTLETVAPSALVSLGNQALATGGAPLRWLPLMLAGNVFTASVRGVFIPLLLGAPVLAKASSRELAFPVLMRDALRAADPALGASFDVVSFAGGDVTLERELVGDACAIAVYGGDATIAEVEARHPNARVIAHGHGLSLAFVARASLDSNDTLRSLALDVAAYDQRGCLSPQAIYVEAGASDAEAFAERLCKEGLGRIAASLPRGPLPLAVGGAQAQWRGLAEVRGRLFRGPEHAVALVDQDSMQWSPGFRNVSVVPVKSLRGALASWAHLGDTLKCIGVDETSLDSTAKVLAESESLTAYACTIGSMQTPPLDAPADGRPPWDGLLA
jgi:hypothetical protein